MEKEIKRILNEYRLNKEMMLEDATQQILRLFDVSNSLFEGTKPLTGKPLELLEKCMGENAKSKPTLKGRL